VEEFTAFIDLRTISYILNQPVVDDLDVLKELGELAELLEQQYVEAYVQKEDLYELLKYTEGLIVDQLYPTREQLELELP
tara:strand:- start:200 stop:439 length:240 start_codon:yes stop_codon:yes gene_type:complete